MYVEAQACLLEVPETARFILTCYSALLRFHKRLVLMR